MVPLKWEDGCLKLLDQTLLPHRVEYIECYSYRDVCVAIRRLSVRGAPAIGVAAAYALALAALSGEAVSREEFISNIERAAEELAATRPTAVNLFWALDRVLRRVRAAVTGDVQKLREVILSEAHAIFKEDLEGNIRIGQFGLELIPQRARILTHCNAGALATAGYGTALGVIRAAWEAGREIQVLADETRPLLQGSRLTTWELIQEGIPVTLITDSMAAFAMARGMVDLVLVGADRITANGDVANKIGTYGLAVLAREHGIPFYVAAPLSTVDFSLESGDKVIVEERHPDEVTHLSGHRVAPEGVRVWNPAFDITPAAYVTAIITDHGVVRAPYRDSLAQLKRATNGVADGE